MPQMLKMVASELLMCGLKKIPLAGDAIEVVDAIRSRYEQAALAEQVGNHEERLSRFEQRQRDLVASEFQAILANLGQVNLSGNVIAEEVRNLQQIQSQGWSTSLFEGLFSNSALRDDLRRYPEHFGRKLGDRDKVSPENCIHILIGSDKTNILELPYRSLSTLLAQQAKGVPPAKVDVAEDVWAIKNSQNRFRASRIQVNEYDAVGRFLRDLETAITPRPPLAEFVVGEWKATTKDQLIRSMKLSAIRTSNNRGVCEFCLSNGPRSSTPPRLMKGSFEISVNIILFDVYCTDRVSDCNPPYYQKIVLECEILADGNLAALPPKSSDNVLGILFKNNKIPCTFSRMA